MTAEEIKTAAQEFAAKLDGENYQYRIIIDAGDGENAMQIMRMTKLVRFHDAAQTIFDIIQNSNVDPEEALKKFNEVVRLMVECSR